jgi:hypothetical protein
MFAADVSGIGRFQSQERSSSFIYYVPVKPYHAAIFPAERSFDSNHPRK